MALNSKHLSTGDAYPDLPSDDKLILFTMRYCPFAHRTHLVLNAKNVPHHVVNLDLKKKPNWVSDYSAPGKAPALGLTNEPGRPFIGESLIIADYLDEKYPDGRRLYPSEPMTKALERLWIQRFDDVIMAWYHAVILKTGKWAIVDIAPKLQAFEEELGRRGTRFFGGDGAPGMLDYMIWPWIERWGPMTEYDDEREAFQMRAEQFPLLYKYYGEMGGDEAVKVTFLSGDDHHRFILTHISDTPDYEMLNKQ